MNTKHAELCSSLEWAEYLRSDVVPWAQEGMDLPESLLEIGPGYGAATEMLLGQVGRLVAVEKDPVLAARLAERFRGRGGVDVVEGDATRLELDDDSVGAATCFTMLHHVPTTELQNALFVEAARVVRPGGWFFGVDSLGGRGFEEFHRDDVCVVVDPLTLAGRLEAAGFEDVQVSVLAMGVRFRARTPVTSS